MPLDLVRRLITPLRQPVATSRYPHETPLLQPATRGLPQIDPTRCQGDGACVEACPTSAIEFDAGRARSIDAGKCVFCSACVLACPNGALWTSYRVELARPGRADLIDRPPVSAAMVDATSSSDLTATGAFPPPPTPADEDRARALILGRFGRSLHVRHLDAGSCNGCDFEAAALVNPYHDVQRLGIDFVASPRHADLLLVTGVMTRNLEEAAVRTYEAMPDPRMVVAVGACAIGGGVFAGSPQIRDGASTTLPIDVFVPGCPPRPEAIIEGMLMAIELHRPARPGGR
jgi:Ni,Fe-hydrogenase III small subunit/formate hydrogenlyase subunit 6/NADH:ubiquinone oxidoreductase subunit I